MKILLWRADFFHPEKLIVAFRSFSKVSKKRKNGTLEEQAFKMNKVTGPNKTNNNFLIFC